MSVSRIAAAVGISIGPVRRHITHAPSLIGEEAITDRTQAKVNAVSPTRGGTSPGGVCKSFVGMSGPILPRLRRHWAGSGHRGRSEPSGGGCGAIADGQCAVGRQGGAGRLMDRESGGAWLAMDEITTKSAAGYWGPVMPSDCKRCSAILQ